MEEVGIGKRIDVAKDDDSLERRHSLRVKREEKERREKRRKQTLL